MKGNNLKYFNKKIKVKINHDLKVFLIECVYIGKE